MDRTLKIYKMKWDSFTDTQRWRAVINNDFNNMTLVLDNDEIYLIVKNQGTQEDKDFILEFDNQIPIAYTLLDALNIKYTIT